MSICAAHTLAALSKATSKGHAMNQSTRLGLLGLSGVTLLLVATAGGYYAWDRGFIPGNPRAPTVEAMAPAVERMAMLALGDRNSQCIGPTNDRLKPDAEGIAGIGSATYPGQHSLTYLVTGAPHTQDARNRRIRQLNFFARQGFLQETELLLATESGQHAARQYQLTWDGFVQMAWNRGPAEPCFHIGRRVFNGISALQKLPEQLLGMEIYQIEYETVATDVPAWARSEEAKELLPELAARVSPRREHVRLFRGNEGWLTEYEAQLEIVALKDPRRGEIVRRELDRLQPAKSPAIDIPLDALVEQYFADDGVRGMQRSRLACMPLRVQRGGDLRQATQGQEAHSVTYFDFPATVRKEHEQLGMFTQLHMLNALKVAGLAQSREVGPATVRGVQVARGIEFTIAPDAVSALNSAGAWCVPAGRMEIELLAVRPDGRGGAVFAGRAKLAQTPEWVAKLGEHLPALRAVIEQGIPVEGSLDYMEDPLGADGTGAQQKSWTIVALASKFPVVRAMELPESLQPLLPETAAIGRTLVKTPWVNSLSAMSPAASVVVPPVAHRPASIPKPSVAAATTADTQPPSIPQAEPVRKALYPAGEREVHAISVYQGKTMLGSGRDDQRHAEGAVEVQVSSRGKDILLVLAAYEPVEWRITVDGGASLQQVLAIGFHPQRVTIRGSSGTQIASRRNDIWASVGVRPDGSFPYRNDGNAGREANDLVIALTGKSPSTFQASYTGERFSVSNVTPRFAMPAQAAPGTMGGEPIGLRRGGMDQNNRGLLVQHEGYGAFTEAWATRGFSAGKLYFEGRMIVAERKHSRPHANMGLAETTSDGGIDHSPDRAMSAIRFGEQVLYKDGDVFGYAADLAAGMAYVHVNGQWITGPPGSGRGLQLKKNREYAALFLATGGPGGTSWQANLGRSAFKFAPPEGYEPYDRH